VTTLVDLGAEAHVHVPELARLPSFPHSDATAIATWRARMLNEEVSAASFEALGRQMAAAGYDAAQVAECAAFAEEERQHGVVYGAIVQALGGHAYGRLPDATPPLPLHAPHADIAPREGVLQNLLSICCMAETFAVAVLEAERVEMAGSPLRDLIARIHADEVRHARFGWHIVALEVPALDAAAKARLGAHLAVAFARFERDELANLPPTAGRDARALFYETAFHVIVPALEAHGLSARAAWEARGRSA
jgi:hypothetical protein